MKRALILFAHGARDPEWANPFKRLADAVQQRMDGVPVHLAFLEFMQPDLPQALYEAMSAGADEIEIVPVFLAQGGHVRREVPLMIEQFVAAHPQARIRLRPALGEDAGVIEAMAKAVAQA